MGFIHQSLNKFVYKCVNQGEQKIYAGFTNVIDSFSATGASVWWGLNDKAL